MLPEGLDCEVFGQKFFDGLWSDIKVLLVIGLPLHSSKNLLHRSSSISPKVHFPSQKVSKCL